MVLMREGELNPVCSNGFRFIEFDKNRQVRQTWVLPYLILFFVSRQQETSD